MKLTLTVENTDAGRASLHRIKSVFRDWEEMYGEHWTNNICVNWTRLVQSTTAQIVTAVIAEEPLVRITIERDG